MSSRWLREIPASATGSRAWSDRFWCKAVVLFLYRVMGYTFQSETVTGGNSFVSHQKTGVGDVTGTGFNFSRTSGDVFASTDVNSWLFIRDDANPRNGGAYQIVGYVDPNNVIIDFAGGPTEFPTASASVNWWLTSQSYQVPVTSNDTVDLQSRHSTGWAIRLTINNSSGMRYFWARVCVDGNWADGKILGASSAPTAMHYGPYDSTVISVEGDYDGEWLNLIVTKVEQSGWQDANWMRSDMVSVARIDPVETGHDTLELTALNGGYGPDSYCGSRLSQVAAGYNDTWGLGRVWNVAANAEKYIFPVELSIGGLSNTIEWQRFPRTAQVNRRLGDKLEVRYGTYFIMDQNNIAGRYQLYGRVKGHWTLPIFESCSGNYNWNLDQRPQKRFFPCTWQTNKDFLVLQNGFMIPWPGVGPARTWE